MKSYIIQETSDNTEFSDYAVSETGLVSNQLNYCKQELLPPNETLISRRMLTTHKNTIRGNLTETEEELNGIMQQNILRKEFTGERDFKAIQLEDRTSLV